MHLMEYWPSATNIKDCIATEAEELHQHTLLAVHEPMRLLRRDKDGNSVGYDSENDLLEHFLATPRPLPIIGKAGVGKSHIIRWLDANLRLRPDAKQWHIVRIPKNASLREVLTILLAGLEGEEFKVARLEVQNVAEKLNSEEIAGLLLTFMGQQLKRLLAQTNEEVEAIRNTGKQISPEREKELRKLRLHALENSLPALITDPFFKKFLLDKNHCLFRLASRLTDGSKNNDLSENQQQLSASDLSFNFNISDLSAPARKYVQQARLNTHLQAREEAAEVLNLVLGEATRNLFRQLFNFNGGGFPDLFNNIRRALHAKNMTLMVLVEDMSLISAIEDVLIDSLEREGRRDGEDILCPVCSAIAVTDGYAGYMRRQQGMRDRAKGEWVIEEVLGDREDTHSRIVNFCSRYINAARWGSNNLKDLWQKHLNDPKNQPWPPVWNDDKSDREFLDAFGKASTGISLYPYNHNAIRALAEKQCRDAMNNLKFNPRQVINKILLEILEKYRWLAESNEFPPADLARISAPGALRASLNRLGLDHPGRAESVAAIWGYPAETFEQLRDKLSADIAVCFSIPKMAAQLKAGVIEQPTNSEHPRVTGSEAIDSPPHLGDSTPIAPETDPDVEQIKAFGKKLDAWFSGEQTLGQDEARILRSGLARLFKQHTRSDWHGVKRAPDIKSGSFVNIELPNAEGNRGQHTVKFCNENDFSDQVKSISLQETAMAIIRFGHYNKARDDEDWSYPDAAKDLMLMHSFAAHWVPKSVNAMINAKRQELDSQLEAHVHAARALGLFKESDSVRGNLNRLLFSNKKLEAVLKPPSCNTVEKIRETMLGKWEGLQSAWLDWMAANDHALEGDLLFTAFKNARSLAMESQIAQWTVSANRDLQTAFDCINLISDVENSEDFSIVFNELSRVSRVMVEEGKYPSGQQFSSWEDLTEQLTYMAENPIWDTLSKMQQITQLEQPTRQWQLLCDVDGDKLNRYVGVMQEWKKLFNLAHTNLQTTNSEWGAQALTESKNQIDELLKQMAEDLATLQRKGVFQQEIMDENA
ncbi:protein DpdH [Shewanella algae]|uniref:protein DpdH n=1 Tax=Shewanella algae TaxID=38313 RepID=UPI001C5A2A03|nr:protein DpdH [Shewanella algae]